MERKRLKIERLLKHYLFFLQHSTKTANIQTVETNQAVFKINKSGWKFRIL